MENIANTDTVTQIAEEVTVTVQDTEFADRTSPEVVEETTNPDGVILPF